VPRINHLVDLFQGLTRKVPSLAAISGVRRPAAFGKHGLLIEFYVELSRLALFNELPRRGLLGNSLHCGFAFAASENSVFGTSPIEQERSKTSENGHFLEPLGRQQ
jgi:hypothetical protein